MDVVVFLCSRVFFQQLFQDMDHRDQIPFLAPFLLGWIQIGGIDVFGMYSVCPWKLPRLPSVTSPMVIILDLVSFGQLPIKLVLVAVFK